MVGFTKSSQLLTVKFLCSGSGPDATLDNNPGTILREVCNNKARQGPPLLCVWNVCPQGSPQLFLDYYKTFICRWTTTVRGWTIVWPSTTTSFSSFSWCMDSSIAFMSPLQAWNIFFRYLFPHICMYIYLNILIIVFPLMLPSFLNHFCRDIWSKCCSFGEMLEQVKDTASSTFYSSSSSPPCFLSPSAPSLVITYTWF